MNARCGESKRIAAMTMAVAMARRRRKSAEADGKDVDDPRVREREGNLRAQGVHVLAPATRIREEARQHDASGDESTHEEASAGLGSPEPKEGHHGGGAELDDRCRNHSFSPPAKSGHGQRRHLESDVPSRQLDDRPWHRR